MGSRHFHDLHDPASSLHSSTTTLLLAHFTLVFLAFLLCLQPPALPQDYSSVRLECFPRELLMAAPSLLAGLGLKWHLSLERPSLTFPILVAPSPGLSPFPCPVLFFFITQLEIIADSYCLFLPLEGKLLVGRNHVCLIPQRSSRVYTKSSAQSGNSISFAAGRE